eukprot:gene17175-biopygen12345
MHNVWVDPCPLAAPSAQGAAPRIRSRVAGTRGWCMDRTHSDQRAPVSPRSRPPALDAGASRARTPGTPPPSAPLAAAAGGAMDREDGAAAGDAAPPVPAAAGVVARRRRRGGRRAPVITVLIRSSGGSGSLASFFIQTWRQFVSRACYCAPRRGAGGGQRGGGGGRVPAQKTLRILKKMWTRGNPSRHSLKGVRPPSVALPWRFRGASVADVPGRTKLETQNTVGIQLFQARAKASVGQKVPLSHYDHTSDLQRRCSYAQYALICRNPPIFLAFGSAGCRGASVALPWRFRGEGGPPKEHL